MFVDNTNLLFQKFITPLLIRGTKPHYNPGKLHHTPQSVGCDMSVTVATGHDYDDFETGLGSIHEFFCIATWCDAIQPSRDVHNYAMHRNVTQCIATQGLASYCDPVFALSRGKFFNSIVLSLPMDTH